MAIIGVAFAVHPIHASHLVFLLVLGAGAVTLAAGGVTWMGDRALCRRRRRAQQLKRRRLLVLDCRTLYEALTAFASEADHERPRQWILGGGRFEEWRSTTCARYRRRFREWALRVFDQAVDLDIILPNSRPLVDAPAATELQAVCDLFHQIQQRLE